MVFITKPNVIFTKFRRDMLGFISSKSSQGSPSPSFPFPYFSRSFTISDGLFDAIRSPTINVNSMPVFFINQSGKLFSSRPVGLGLSLTFSGPRLAMSRYFSVFLRPTVLYFSLESRISITSISTFEQKRNKTSKKSPKRPEHDSDSDTDDEEPMQGTKVLKVRLQSLRTDGVLKKALGVARNKVETAFYEGYIRVNGKKPMKKSHQLKIGDEVDLIRGTSPVNPDLLNISRVEILSVEEDDDGDQLLIKVRRTKTLYIENYEADPWKKGSTEQDT